MSAPDHSDTVESVYASKHYDLTTKLGCGCFLEDAVWALYQRDQRWGHLKKNPGQNQWNGHAVDACLWYQPGASQAIDLIRAGESTDAEIGWNPDIPRPEYDTRWYAPTGPNNFVLPPHSTRLGCSLFWLLAGFKYHREQLRANLEWIKGTLKADYIRALAVVGGDEFPAPGGGMADPWKDIGAFLSWPDYDSNFREAHDFAVSHGLDVEWSLIGGRGQVPTRDSLLAVCDRVTNLLAGRLTTTELIECGNEPTVNALGRDDARAMAERLRNNLGPDVRIALGTPAEAMASPGEHDKLPADVTSWYKGCPADAITPHWCRSEPNNRDMGPDTPESKYSNEPRGPEASAGGDTADPLYLGNDYMQACLAEYRGYVFHTAAGVWGGHCHGFPEENKTSDVFAYPEAEDIAAVLSDIRAGLTPSPIPGPGPTPTPGQKDKLLSGQMLLPEQSLISPGKQAHLHYQQDGNLVVYLDGTPVWASHTDGQTAGSLQMQPDGNLVLHSTTGPIRATRTDGHPGAMVQLQDDGNFVVYEDPMGPLAGTPLWASATDEFYS